mmetsp:Transcript_13448/g.30901  ORF Transcript_13448/g.30901 Transcript_13448/m.30901 type:complete len:149 (-) Transcript_13448:279-725(-)
MDSLLYLGAGDADEGEEEADEGEEDEQGEEDEESATRPCTSADAASSSLSFESLVRAGYSGQSADLSQTDTFKRLTEEAAAKLADRQQRLRAEEDAEAAREKARQGEKQRIFSREEIDKRLGYEKRFDRTGEDFRSKARSLAGPRCIS